MVSIGTVFTLGIVAAVGIAGYAIYSNFGKIGTALSLGVTKSISDPFGNWLDSLFKDTSTTGNINTPQDIIVQQGGQVVNTGFVDDPNKFNPPGVTHYGYPDSPYGIPITNGVTPTPTPPNITVTPKPGGGSLISVELTEGGAPVPQPTAPVITVNGETWTQKLYKLLTPGGECIGTTCVQPIPLSTSQIYSYAMQGKLAHEVYL